MKVAVIQIGNSTGIRIPKTLLDACHIIDQVELEKKGRSIVIRPISNKPRQGWAKAFSAMHKRKEDTLLLDDGVEDLAAFGWN